jgi:HEPN domain-containing protein
MILTNDLRILARARLRDAAVLLRNMRYDAAVYLCGYAVEIALKVRICRTLKWLGFPETRAEFQDYQSFRTHDLNVLLHLTGVEDRIKMRYTSEWSVVAIWNPEMRYRSIGSITRTDAERMIEATRSLVRAL